MLSYAQVLELLKNNKFAEVDAQSFFSFMRTHDFSGDIDDSMINLLQSWATATNDVLSLNEYLKLALPLFSNPIHKALCLCHWFLLKDNEKTANKIIYAFLSNDDLSWPANTKDADILIAKELCPTLEMRAYMLAAWLKKPASDLTSAELKRCLACIDVRALDDILAAWAGHGSDMARVIEAIPQVSNVESFVRSLLHQTSIFSTLQVVSACLTQTDNDDFKSDLIFEWLLQNRNQADKAPIDQWILSVGNFLKRNNLAGNVLTNHIVNAASIERYCAILPLEYGKERYYRILNSFYQFKGIGNEGEWPKLLSLAETVEEQRKLIELSGLTIAPPPIDMEHTIEYWIDHHARGREVSELCKILNLYEESRHDSIVRHWFQQQTTFISYESLKKELASSYKSISSVITAGWVLAKPMDAITFEQAMTDLGPIRKESLDIYNKLSEERSKAFFIKMNSHLFMGSTFCKEATALSQFSDENFKTVIESMGYKEGIMLNALREAHTKDPKPFVLTIIGYGYGDSEEKKPLVNAWLDKNAKSVSAENTFDIIISNKTDRVLNEIAMLFVQRLLTETEQAIPYTLVKKLIKKSVLNEYRSKIITSWLSNVHNAPTVADLYEITDQPFYDENTQETFCDLFGKRYAVMPFDKLAAFIQMLKSDNKLSVMLGWLAGQQKNFLYNDFNETILTQLNDPSIRSKLIVYWIKIPTNNLSVAQMISILFEQSEQDRCFYSYFQQIQLCQAWIDKSEPEQSIEDIYSLGCVVSQSNIPFSVVSRWVYQMKPSFDQLKLIVVKLPDDKTRIDFYSQWLSILGRTISPHAFVAFVEAFHDKKVKSDLSSAWAQCYFSESKIMLSEFESDYESLVTKPDKLICYAAWLEQTQNNISYQKLLEIISHSKDDSAEKLLEKWLSKTENTIEDDAFCALAGHLHLDNKTSLILNRIRSQSDDNDPYEIFLRYIQMPRLFMMYHPDKIVTMMQALGINLLKIIEISSLLYPNNDASRAILFYEAVKLYPNNIRDMLLGFLPTLHDDQAFEDIYKASDDVRSALSPLEWLNFAETRVAEKYGALKTLLALPIDEALTEEGLKAAKDYFKDELTGKHLSAVFMFFDLTNQMGLLTNETGHMNGWIKSDVIAKLVEQYVPPSDKPYMTQEEHEKLFALGIPPLPSMHQLCQVLNNRMPVIPTVEKSEEIIAEMNDNILPDFPKVFLTLLKKNKEYHVFRKPIADVLYMLQHSAGVDSNDPTIKAIEDRLRSFDQAQQDLVVAFFEKSMQLDDSIKPDEATKLFDFFDKNIASVAFIFSHQDGRITFQQLLGSLGEGCVANIGTQVRIAVYRYLFKNDVAGNILYACFADKIVAPIFSKGDKLGASASGTDPFSSSDIINCFISPPGLTAALIDNYYSNDALVQDPWEPIKRFYTLPVIMKKRGITESYLKMLEETDKSKYHQTIKALDEAVVGYHEEFMECLYPSGPSDKSFNEKAASFLVYIALRESFSDICAHGSMADFSKENQGYLDKLNNVIASQEITATTHPSFISQHNAQTVPPNKNKLKPET